MPTTFTAIGYTSLSATASSVSFTSIPATYTDLKLVASVRGDIIANTYFVLGLVLNGVSGANNNFRSAYMEGQGSSLSPGQQTNNSWAGFPVGSGTSVPTNLFGSFELYIANYGSNRKTVSIWGNTVATSAITYTTANGISWNDTSAVTSIGLNTLAGTGNFATNSTFTLYGIKRA